MAQKTDLNINPYYDDFDSTKNFYKVLFKPGFPVQARELTTLQSILQNQIEGFGSHIFKEGSMVIPGNVTYDNQFYAIKLDNTNFGVDISVYINNFLNKKITGLNSGTKATIKYIALPEDSDEVEYITIYVKYKDSDNNFEFNQFEDGESLFADENVVYGNTTIPAGTTFANTILSEASSTGSAVSIARGIYFVRGYFVEVSNDTLILDYYSNTPSYRVGLKVEELLVSSKDDSSLYDPSKGFSNYAAPGADRLQINLSLTKKSLDDTNDSDFIEVLRVDDGKVKKVLSKSSYNLIRDYLAKRTFDESGDYSINSYEVSIDNSLNNRLGNDGLFFSDEKTDQGNDPSDDLMCIKVSPGKSYVQGYDVETVATTILDVNKPRDTQSINATNIPFEMGNILRVNNVSGVPAIKKTVELYNKHGAGGIKIGDARVYTFNLTDSSYTGSSTNWDLYLYDIQTYTTLILNRTVNVDELPVTSYVKGKSSGASGYLSANANGTDHISLRQTSGSFISGEQIIINGIDSSATIKSIKSFGTREIKSVKQTTAVSGFNNDFTADCLLDKFSLPNSVSQVTISAGSGGVSQVTSPGKVFTGIKTDTVIRYNVVGLNTETFNIVSSVSDDGSTMELSGISTVAGVFIGGLPTTEINPFITIGAPVIRNEESGQLYEVLPNSNVSTINLSNSILSVSEQITGESTNASGELVFDISQTGISTAFFKAFDQERYSVHYDAAANGGIGTITSDSFVLNGGSDEVTISGLTGSESDVIVNVTLDKNNIQSKIKQYTRSTAINVNQSIYPESGTAENTSTNDGLTYNRYYGLRVQDQQISLNYPDVVKVLAVYESLDSNNPSPDRIAFPASANVTSNAIVGENIIGKQSNTIARVLSKSGVPTNSLDVIFLNENRFIVGENVEFEESNITTEVQSITLGQYNDITNSFTLDKGQKDQYYDYSRIVRRRGEKIPSKRLLVIFDHYTVPTSETGDLFTILSYDQERFAEDIPLIGPNQVRASDTLDFRPRVPQFTGLSTSPFDFSARSFDSSPKLIVKPNESSLVGYEYYLGRIDKVYLDKYGVFSVVSGSSGNPPREPVSPDDVMNIATIVLPPYLYNPDDAEITFSDNRRYTMRDIGRLEDRVEQLETLTSLSLLELGTEVLQVQDADGNNRFKSGFFVDDFKNSSLSNNEGTSGQSSKNTFEPIQSSEVLEFELAAASNLPDNQIDNSIDYELLDSNVKKTGNLVTLNYQNVGWLEQPLATRVENVNPFHVVTYNGSVKLSPSSDSWVRTIRLSNRAVSNNRRVADPNRAGQRTTNVSSRDVLVSSGTDVYMRSRGVEFFARNLKPLTKFYQFLDGNGSVNYVPKLLEIANDDSLQNYGASTAFEIGETVIGYSQNKSLIRFRVASPNHKKGKYNDPSETFNINPYVKTENIPSAYSSSSKVLNVDTFSLADKSQGAYDGYVTKGMLLVGQSSGAIAYVKDLRLISDNYGDLIGSFFLKDPYGSPTPTVRIRTGTKTYKLTNSSTNATPLPGSKLTSSAETPYKSSGRFEVRQRVTTRSTVEFYDPLAQSFSVGGNVEAPNLLGQNNDDNGAFLTAVDLYFANKPTGNDELKVELRTVELGTPTRTVVGNPVILKPSDITTSTNGEVATTATFDYPIYLAPGNEYAIVLVAETTDEYEVWIAEMGEKTINTQSLPDAESVRYTKQFALGSLFKSQNGSIWTADQYQDLKFKLYKANFTSSKGTAYFYNPPLNEYNTEILPNNPLLTLPKQVTVGIDTITDTSLIGILTTGRKISGSEPYVYGTVIGTGSSVGTVSIAFSGTNYVADSDVETYAITGKGSGLKLSINTDDTGRIIGVPTAIVAGNGYSIGDVVGIVTSSVSSNTGRNAVISIDSISGLDTLYLSNVQGDTFTVGAALSYYNNSGTVVSLASTTIRSYSKETNQYSGNYLQVSHFNHAMYANNNKLVIYGAESNTAPTTLSARLDSSEVSTISVGSTANLNTFEGVTVSASNPGYIIIKPGDEIVSYDSVGSGTLTITSGGRGIGTSVVMPHEIGSEVYKYELNGVSLRRINTSHDISDLDIRMDNYYVEIDRSSNGTDRSSDGSVSGAPELSFTNESSLAGNSCKVTKNIQFTEIVPNFEVFTPGSNTSATANIRTITGTSVDGTEVSFQDNGFESIELNSSNSLDSVRVVCSKANEDEYLNGLPRNKSLTIGVTMSSDDPNLSPYLFTDTLNAELKAYRFNNPILDFSKDNRVNSIENDPHETTYVSNDITLANPATSLKVILSAYRHESADIRVLYKLLRADSQEVTQEFELFPGYDNMTDTDNDGFGDNVIDPSKNSGRSDAFVRSSLDGEFLEYQFTADNLDLFTGYAIKIILAGTNQAYAPKIKELRTIALR